MELSSNLIAISNSVDAHLSLLRLRDDQFVFQSKHGITSLPNDLLRLIFQHGSTGNNAGCEFALSVSHVCRHFRRIALDTPLLWSTITNEHSLEGVKTYLARTKMSPLTIALNEGSEMLRNPQLRNARPSVSDILELTVPNCARWKEFRFRIFRAFDSLDQRALRSYENLILPDLTRLVISAGQSFRSDDDNDPMFFSTWHMPALQHISFINVLPALPTAIALHLTSLSVTLQRWLKSSLLNRLLHLLLIRLPALQRLDLCLWNLADDGVRIDPATLPLLEVLSVHIHDSNSHTYIRRFIRALTLPSLFSLSVIISSKGPASVSTWLDHTLPRADNCQALRFVNLKITDAEEQGNAMVVLFERFPQIKHLAVEAPHVRSPHFLSMAHTLPALTTIILKNCGEFGKPFEDSVREALKEGLAHKDCTLKLFR